MIMVAALSSPTSAGGTRQQQVFHEQTPQQENGRLLTSALTEKGNGEVTRKQQQRSREITSRYKSTTTTTPTAPTTPPSARRFPSPVVGRSLTGSEPPKRAVSAERRRSESPASSGSLHDGKASSSGSSSSRPSTPRTVSRTSSTTGNADGLRSSSQRLWPSTHNLSASLQLDHTLKPAENGIRRASASDTSSGKASDRKGTPERKRTPVRRPTTDQTENARPVDNAEVKPDVHRWPAANSPKSLSRSVDLSSDKDKAGRMAGVMVQGRAMSGTARPVRRTPPIRSLSRSINEGPLPDSPQSISRHMLSESRGRTKRELENSPEQNHGQFPDETESAISEGQPSSLDNISDCESLSSAGSAVTSASVKKGSLIRSRRPQGDIVGCSLTEQDFSSSLLKGGRRLKSLSLSAASPSSAGVSPGRLSSSGSQPPPSPSRMLVSSPFRSIPSPTRTRVPSFQLPPSGHNSRASLSSLLHFPLDLRKGKKAMSQQEEAQYLRILHNRWLQWCFVNARAEAARTSQKAIAERSIYNAWLQTSELRKSVAMKRIKLQQARQARKLHTILSSQGPQLESWAALQQEHSAALSGAMEALEAAVLRVPVTVGARADVQAIIDALGCAVDVMGSVESSAGNLLPKSQKMDALVSELAEVTKQEKTVLEECTGLLDRIAALEIEERSLRTHFVQLECEKSRNLIPLRTTTPAQTC